MPVRTFYASLCERNMLNLLDWKGLPRPVHVLPFWLLLFIQLYFDFKVRSTHDEKTENVSKLRCFTQISDELKNIIMKKYFQRIEYFLLLIIFLPILMKFLRLSQCLDREQHFETSHHRQQFQFSRRNSFRKVQQSSRDAIEADILFLKYSQWGMNC